MILTIDNIGLFFSKLRINCDIAKAELALDVYHSGSKIDISKGMLWMKLQKNT